MGQRLDNERLADGFYTLVGLGVLSVQRMAVERRAVHQRLRTVAGHVDAVVDPLLDGVVARLPGPAGEALNSARQVARAGRRLLIGA